MAKSQLFAQPGHQVHLLARRRLPGSPRPPGRGGVQDRLRDPRPRRLPADVPGGRALAHAAGSVSRARASAGSRSSPGVPVVPVAIHGSMGVRGWRKLQFPKVTVQYGEPLTFEAVSRARRASSSWRSPSEIFEPVREMYAALEEKGRRGVIKALREGIGATHRAPGPGRASLASGAAAAAAHSYFASSVGQCSGSWPGHDHGLGVLARWNSASSWQRAPPGVAVEGARRLRCRPRAGRACRWRRPRSRSRGRAGGRSRTGGPPSARA